MLFLLFFVVIAGQLISSETQYARPERKEHLIRADNGLSIHIREVIPVQQQVFEPLVMVHGEDLGRPLPLIFR